jgi:methionine synthase II (cobalamin-independent)
MLTNVEASRLILNSDCGFAPGHDNPISIDEAYLKLKSVASTAERLRDRIKR